MLSLYLHIPFCSHRCAYCDFNTYTSLNNLHAAYVDALCAEIRQVGGDKGLAVKTIFFGGGTPSLLSPELWAQIMDALRETFDVLPNAEVTMEMNPNTVDVGYLSAVRATGINRISFGMQSARQSELQLLERAHSFETVIQAVADARTAGFDNLNLDLIYGLPHQSLTDWQESVKSAVSLNPEHLSLYCLIIEPGTPMQRWLKNGDIPMPDGDLSADQYDWSMVYLADQDFNHYEISNWAKSGRECEHNLTYWRNETYLGLGAGAHGHANNHRYHVVKQPRVYIRRMQEAEPIAYPFSSAIADKEALTEREAMADTVITQLRLLQEGLDLAGFEQRFGKSLRDAYGLTVDQQIGLELLSQKGNRLLLTEKGRFLSNMVFRAYV